MLLPPCYLIKVQTPDYCLRTVIQAYTLTADHLTTLCYAQYGISAIISMINTQTWGWVKGISAEVLFIKHLTCRTDEALLYKKEGSDL